MAMAKIIQAKDIPEPDILRVLDSSGSRWEIARVLGYPEKIVLARLRSLLRRGLVSGCACGCRGDFSLTAAGEEALETA